MGLFDLFKEDTDKVRETKINSPFELFSFDFSNIPDETFKKIDEGETEEGIKFTISRKWLERKELDIFDTIEVVEFDTGGKNFVFTGSTFSHNNISRIKNIINSLYSYYGPDDLGEGKFDRDDEAILRDGIWTGRMWNSHPNKPHVMITGYPEEGWSLAIWTN
ncbi:MAG: hypothetical protein PHT26_15465 [Lentimicrobiaceae bacterium]|nr:hypothetical protein [Lentimicrobiaceae bacterium]